MTGCIRRIIATVTIGTVAGSMAVVSSGGHGPVLAGEKIETDEIVVKLSYGVDVDAFVARWELTIVDEMLISRGIYAMQVEFDASDVKPKDIDKKRADHVKNTIKDMEKSGEVAYADPNHDMTVTDGRLHFWELEPMEMADVDLDADDYLTQRSVVDLRLTDVHQLSRGAGSTIAILDTGIDLDHPQFADRLAPGYDYVDDDETPDDTADGVDNDGDGHVDEGAGHGTAVAGLAHLIAPDATLMPFRILDSEGNGNVFVLAEAIVDAVLAGANVINLSAGVNHEVKSELLDDAIDFAHQRGVVVIAAAGNEGGESKTSPASNKNVIAVAGTEADDPLILARFSNRGKWIMLAAPAADLVTTKPGGYTYASGTSMSSPFVAGGIALADAAVPGAASHKRGHDLVNVVKDTGRKLRGEYKIDKGSIDLMAVLAKMSDQK